MGKYFIHMIGHGHIDPTWLWTWKEGFEEIRATFRSALERMDETAEFKFTASSACFYSWMKESELELYEKIRQRVKENRWEIVGGFWVEPDCNIPCGESIVRQGLYAQRFFEREFGKKCRIGFNPDSFGHAATLPQLLKKLGMDFYVFMRPEPGKEMEYPGGGVFWWQSGDGSSVLAAQIPLGYDTSGRDVVEKINSLPYVSSLVPGQNHIMCFYGVGNHGGGPTREAIVSVTKSKGELNSRGLYPEFSTLEVFFNGFREETPSEHIPVINQELQHHARGCYSTHSEVKYNNRRTEHLLMSAERLVTAWWLMNAGPYPAAEIEACWKDLLYNQFHDILAGTSLESSYVNTRDQIGGACHRAEIYINRTVQHFARDTDTSSEGNAVVVFNTLCWPVCVPVTAPPNVTKNLGKRVYVAEVSGKVIPCQAIRGERIDHVRYRFLAELPALGYRVYKFRTGHKEITSSQPLSAGEGCIRNLWWTLEFDRDAGEIVRLKDNLRNIDVLRRGHILAVMTDHSDTWSHDLQEYRVEAGRFTNANLHIVEQGDIQCTLRMVSRFASSTIISEYTLYRDTDRIDCDMRINWQQHYQTLKLGFETHIEEGVGTYEIPYGCAERTCDGGEEPGQQWFDLSGTIKGLPYGLAILNDGKYGFDIRDGVMRVTLLRSPAYAHHDNGRFQADQYWPVIDQGWQRVKFVLLPHTGNRQGAAIAKRAWELNAAPIVHPESSHPGQPAPERGIIEMESESVLVTVVKKSEDDNDIIVRAYETQGKNDNTRLYLPTFNKFFNLHFTPHEINTVRINKNTWQLCEVNLLEE